MAIDFQGLLNVLHAAENEPNFDMGGWVKYIPDCGTTHCMIGAFCDSYRGDKLTLDPTLSQPVLGESKGSWAVAARFGLAHREAQWLFTGVVASYSRNWEHAINFDKPQALARLRKFIYYKLHKQEMELDTARRISGRNSVVLAAQA